MILHPMPIDRRQLRSINIRFDLGPFSTCAQAASSEARIDWDREGADALACTTAFAATELAAHLRVLAARRGQRLRVRFNPPPDAPATIEFLLTSSGPTRGDGPSTDGASPDSFDVRADAAGSPRIIIRGASRAGILYGVYAYLNWLGFAWTHFDPRGTSLRYRGRFWEPSLHLAESPAFALRGFHTEPQDKGTPRLFRWMARNRLNLFGRHPRLWPFQKKLGMRLAEGGHLFEPLFDPAARGADGRTLFARHPQWFALRDGKRIPLAGRICLAHPGARRHLLRGIIQAVQQKRRGTDLFKWWPQDTWDPWCQCSRCRALGSPTDRLLHIAAALRRAMDRRRMSRIKLSVCAYEGSGTLSPPTRPIPAALTPPPVPLFASARTLVEFFPINRCYRHALRDRRCDLNRHYAHALRGWLKVPLPLICGEYYNVSRYSELAVSFPRIMSIDLAAHQRDRLAGVHYMHLPDAQWAMRTLTQWQYARLLWSGRDRSRSILADYFDRRYGASAGVVADAYRQVETALADIARLTSWRPDCLREDLIRFSRDASVELGMDQGTHRLDLDGMLETLQRASQKLQAASSRALPAQARWALADDRYLLSYTIAVVTLYRQLRLALRRPIPPARDPPSAGNLIQAAADLRALRIQLSHGTHPPVDGCTAAGLGEIVAAFIGQHRRRNGAGWLTAGN
jgi:hypothetical protein